MRPPYVSARRDAESPEKEARTELKDAVAVVTGGVSGIGRATARALAQAGAHVIVADIDEDGAQTVAREIEEAGSSARAIAVDVTKREEVEALVDRAIAWRGGIDLFVSNVGVGCEGAPEDFTPDEWEYLLRVNLWSAIWPLRTLIPHMRERGRGRLVFVSSGAGFEGFADRAPYNVAKFGIVGLAESVARSLKGSGAGVTLVVPGAIATDGWKLYVIGGSPDAEEIETLRTKQREHSANWPRPETMADAIVEGIRADRYCVVQHNPYQADWFADLNTRKGRDPDAFVLG